jgi:DNA topoisomerase IB
MPRRGGWRRLGVKRFRYVDARDQPITDEEKLARIERLVIPPAWTDVWISPNPGAKLQATGVDRAGRRQYLYHPDHRAAQEAAKYDRLVSFGTRLPALRDVMAEHLGLGPYERDWACALAVSLVNRACCRSGSERSARTSRTYGVRPSPSGMPASADAALSSASARSSACSCDGRSSTQSWRMPSARCSTCRAAAALSVRG